MVGDLDGEGMPEPEPVPGRVEREEGVEVGMSCAFDAASINASDADTEGSWDLDVSTVTGGVGGKDS